MGRVPGCAERFAWAKASRRCSGSSFSICPVAMAELETSYCRTLGFYLGRNVTTFPSAGFSPAARNFSSWISVAPLPISAGNGLR
jgi:hypothetical protein